MSGGLANLTKKGIAYDEINAAAGGSYFSSGSISIVYNEYYAQVDIALYFNIQLSTNASHNFLVSKEIAPRQYLQRIAVSGYGKNLILALTTSGYMTILSANSLGPGDSIRETFFYFRK